MCVFSLGAILVYAGVDWASKRDRPSPRALPISPPDPESSSTPASPAPSPEPILVPTKPHNIQSTLIDILRSIVALPAIYWYAARGVSRVCRVPRVSRVAQYVAHAGWASWW
jgi:hypothetical protein